jgi:CBS domain-containing protein
MAASRKKVADVMTREVSLLNAERSALDAARMLREQDVGMVPVAQNDRLIGVVTDRDIVMRVVAENRDPATVKLETIATNEPKFCFDDEDAEHVARNMDELMVRRLPVVNRDKRLVGIVSIEDIRPRKAA